jgi:hypothetical protein
MYCKVEKCINPNFHVTSAHLCESCRLYGHGKYECDNIISKINLHQYFNDIVSYNDFCTIQNCMFPHTHITIDHSCLYCSKKNTHMKTCPVIDSTCITIIPRKYNLNVDSYYNLKNINIGHYVIIPGELGHVWIVRNNNYLIEYFFIHSDNWGQYGEELNDIPKLNCFIRNYKIQQL